jgi:hypothetical protein
MSRRPPLVTFPCIEDTGSTLSRMSAFSSAADMLGATERTREAAPDTWAVAIEPPLKNPYFPPSRVE